MSLLFITHDLGIVSQIADRVAVMYQGELVEQEKADIFFANPQHPYSQKLFTAIPSWEKREIAQKTLAEQPLLQVKNLKVHYPIKKGVFKRTVGYFKAVDGIDLEIRTGETLALVGESGSGKTTTGKGILRLINPTAGLVKFEEQDLSRLSMKAIRKMRRDMQIVFQDPYSSMNPRMLISDIVAEGMLAQGIGKTAANRRARVEELLQLVGLDPDSKLRYPHEFSGGQRQRICIARSLALEPKLLICDEPTSALDVTVQMQVLKLLQRLQDELGLAYLLITHNLAVVAYMADNVAVMHQGKIVERGSTEQILNAPGHPYTQKLLASMPVIE